MSTTAGNLRIVELPTRRTALPGAVGSRAVATLRAPRSYEPDAEVVGSPSARADGESASDG